MLSLREIKNPDIFRDCPGLTTIWPEPSNSLMQESVQDFFDFYSDSEHLKFDLGSIYTIHKDNLIVGITGLLVLHDNDKVYTKEYNQKYLEDIHLRWHGIIPEYRNQNLGILSLKLVLDKALSIYPNAKNIIERVPDSPNGLKSQLFFEKIGFKKYGETDTFEGSDNVWQPMIAPINEIINYSPKLINKIKLK